MQALRRSARASLNGTRAVIRSQQRRLESSHSTGAGAAESGSPPTSYPPADPNQSIGLSFYALLATIPAIYILHNAATAEDPYFTRIIRKYSDYRDEWLRRNDLHNMAVQRALEDRVLFLNSHVGVSPARRFANPEALNNGSAHNVWAGAYINIDKVVDHYEKINFEDNERKFREYEERQEKKSKKS